ncbi:class I mannose-6-phosphate isomerase [Curtobacterium sp. MCBD17_019]|uniref:class I mannose-6-phosphate isomerase n=1 Tax=Curtobacterium sp. MCBD17_019 TaxID=2175669 RepID=UPI000DA7C332|nr:class I mannose-6-phosphate isomerase [Curtobacterium sp. MCBD17_019]PZE72850.1 hypothetical protein DEI82_14610 [Curtobacterium sp. MCBD17_019]
MPDRPEPHDAADDAARAEWSAAPIRLAANQPPARPYRGGAGIARFRGLPESEVDPYTPEDFVASVTTVHGSDHVGLTELAPGLTLRDAVRADPQGFLGSEHVARFGAETMLLVKLLDTAERLFVHFHPDDDHARTHLGEPRGKTEAWIVLAVADGVDGYASLGFTREVSEADAAAWFAEQDAGAMLAAMHRVPLRPGSVLLVPAGVPHAIGPGITLVELQQPADLSILLEYDGYAGLDAATALMGNELHESLRALDRRAWTAEDVARLVGDPTAPDSTTASVFPPAADPFFRAERIRTTEPVRLPAAFAVVVVVGGSGTMGSGSGTLPLAAGDTVLVPFAVGDVELSPGLDVIRALPPRP